VLPSDGERVELDLGAGRQLLDRGVFLGVLPAVRNVVPVPETAQLFKICCVFTQSAPDLGLLCLTASNYELSSFSKRWKARLEFAKAPWVHDSMVTLSKCAEVIYKLCLFPAHLLNAACDLGRFY